MYQAQVTQKINPTETPEIKDRARTVRATDTVTNLDEKLPI